MRVLLDESLPHDLALLLPGHDVSTVQGRGWSGTKNGALLALTAAEFDAFITADQNLPHQQNLTLFELRVIVVAAKRNRMQDLHPLLTKILDALRTAEPKQVVWVRP